jgi:PPOX class probable F420-dependent enzyme
MYIRRLLLNEPFDLFNTNLTTIIIQPPYNSKCSEMWLTASNLKRKVTTTISSTVHFDKNYLKSDNNNNNKFSTIIGKYSCWCILFVDGINIDAKIIHKGRGKYRIVEDKYKGKYVNKIVDASDVIRCKVTSSNDDDRAQIISSSKHKLAQFSNQQQYINLETYKKSGQSVQTPMWFINYNGVIYVSTTIDSAKVKRLRNNSHVRIAPCNFVGHPNGEWVEAEAHIVNSSQTEKANKLFKQKYDLHQTIFPNTAEEVLISICLLRPSSMEN